MDDLEWDDDSPPKSYWWLAESPVDDEQSPEAPESPPARKRRSRRQAEVVELGEPTDRPLSDGYLEIDLLRERTHISWDPVVSAPPAISRSALTAEQWALIEALYELRLLSAGQILREFRPSIGERKLRRELMPLKAAGIARRGSMDGFREGRGKPIYMLGRQGFALLRDAADHHASGEWRQAEPDNVSRVVHDLARNEWLFAFRSLAPRQLLEFRGPLSGRIVSEKPPSIVPDLTLEVQLEKANGEGMKTDLLIEIEMRNNNKTVEGKARAYDSLVNDWWHEHPRYKALGRPPIVVFVVPDLARARRYISILDEELQGHVVILPHTQTRAEHERGLVPRAKKLYLGRQNVHVAVARDIHQRTLRTCRVPAEPPEERALKAGDASELREVSQPVAQRFQLIHSRDLVDPAT
jgi:Replication-relaxation